MGFLTQFKVLIYQNSTLYSQHMEKKPGKISLLKKAIQLYLQMDSEEKKIIRKRVIDGAHTPDYWLQFLEKGSRFDHYADQVRPYLGNTAAVMLAIAFFLTFFTIPFSFEREFFLISRLGWMIIVTLLFFGSLSLISYIFLKTKDIPNHLRLFVVPLLEVLKEEVYSTELIHLKTDLRKKARKSNEVHRQRNYKPNFLAQYGWALLPLSFFLTFALAFINEDLIFIGMFLIFGTFFIVIFGSMFSKYPKILTTLHDNPWLNVKVRLCDGSLLGVHIKDDIAKYRITRKKRGSSGKTKIKTKTKYKIRTSFLVTLTLPKKRYDVEPVMQAVRNREGIKMKSKEGMKRTGLKVNFRWKTKDIKAVPDFKKFLGLIADAYQKAEPVQN